MVILEVRPTTFLAHFNCIVTVFRPKLTVCGWGVHIPHGNYTIHPQILPAAAEYKSNTIYLQHTHTKTTSKYII